MFQVVPAASLPCTRQGFVPVKTASVPWLWVGWWKAVEALGGERSIRAYEPALDLL